MNIPYYKRCLSNLNLASVYEYKIYEIIFLLQNPYFFTKQQINSFDIFLKYFVNFTRIVASGDVFLRSSFLLSKRCDLAVSGLAINIDQQQFTADADTKEQKYFSDPNFESFTENAKRFVAAVMAKQSMKRAKK